MHTLQKYKIMRNAGKSLHSKTLKIVPKKIMIQVFKEFGHWKKGALVCDEDDLDPMMDKLFYDKKWNGKGMVQHFIHQHGGEAMTDDEKKFSEAMKTNRLSLFLVKETARQENFIIIKDMLDENIPDLKLVDIGLSETATPGMILATRVVNTGEFHIATGVAYPFPPEQDDEIFHYMEGKRLYGSKKRKTALDSYPLHFYKMYKTLGRKMRTEFEDV